MSWTDDYDDGIDARKKSEDDLDRYFAQKEAELAQQREELKELEAQTLKFYQDSRAKQAADEARFRAAQLEIRPEHRGADILRIFKAHGL